MTVPVVETPGPSHKSLLKGGRGASEQCRDVDGIAPAGRLLTAEGIHKGWDKARQDFRSTMPAYVVQQLASLVGEVEGMALVHEQMVGRCREQHVGDLRRRQAVDDGGAQRPFGGVSAARLGEAPEP